MDKLEENATWNQIRERAQELGLKVAERLKSEPSGEKGAPTNVPDGLRIDWRDFTAEERAGAIVLLNEKLN